MDKNYIVGSSQKKKKKRKIHTMQRNATNYKYRQYFSYILNTNTNTKQIHYINTQQHQQ